MKSIFQLGIVMTLMVFSFTSHAQKSTSPPKKTSGNTHSLGKKSGSLPKKDPKPVTARSGVVPGVKSVTISIPPDGISDSDSINKPTTTPSPKPQKKQKKH